MSGLEYILGDPINEFPEDRPPTLREVLCFYSQFWKIRGSDSMRGKLVAQEIIRVYQRENIQLLNEKSIKNKINKHICNLKKILKFKSKLKTAANIEFEQNFRSKLNEIFEIHQTFETFNATQEIAGASNLCESMEVDNFDGNFFCEEIPIKS